MRVEFCASCGAPLEARWAEIVIVCRYCGGQNAPGPAGAPVPSSVPDDGRPRLSIGGRVYLIEGLLGQGDACDVYLGRWVRRLGERVVIKVLRSLADADLVEREWSTLRYLVTNNITGSHDLARRVPYPIARGRHESGRRVREVLVLSWRSGFQHTLDDVRAAYPRGIDGRAAVWLFKRLLEVLAFAHRCGIIHGAVLPAHVLVHPCDHGAMLLGWSLAIPAASADRERLAALSLAGEGYYPPGTWHERRVTQATDVTMAARCVLAAAGASDFQGPGTLPGRLGELLVAAATGKHGEAWALRERVDQAATVEFGPPRYAPLDLPGWASS